MDLDRIQLIRILDLLPLGIELIQLNLLVSDLLFWGKKLDPIFAPCENRTCAISSDIICRIVGANY